MKPTSISGLMITAIITFSASDVHAQKYLGRVQIGPSGFNTSNRNQFGQGYSGGMHRGPRGFTGQYTQQDRYGNRQGGNFRHGSGGTSAQYFQQGSKGNRQSAYFNNSGRNTRIGYSEYDRFGNGRSGSLSHGPNGTRIQGSKSRIGTIPGTTERIYGDAHINGRNSRFTAGSEMRTLNGTRIGHSSTSISGRGISSQRSLGTGNVRISDQQSIRFQGLNSQYKRQYQANAGPAKGSAKVGVSRKSVQGKASVKVGGQKGTASVKISPHGSKVQIGGVSLGL